MASSSGGLRRFIRRLTVAFGGGQHVAAENAISHWRKALTDLARDTRSLARHFDEIKIHLSENHLGRKIAMIGNIEGIDFARLIRQAESVTAFERAVGRQLRPIERRVFHHLDDIARTHFPDASILRRDNYLTNSTKALCDRLGRDISSLRSLNEDTLEALIRSDPITLKKANRVINKASVSRRVLYLGGTIAVGTTAAVFTIAGLAKMSKDLAEANTGCFMYTRENNTIRKCRVLGCSCPIRKIDSASKHGPQACRENEDIVWDAMWITKSACSPPEEEGGQREPYCVHCDWHENDNESVNYVDKSKLTSDAYLLCEQQSALDAFYDITGNTVDGIGETIGGTVRDSFATSVTIVPWIVTILVTIIAIVVATSLWIFVRSRIIHNSRSDE